MDAHKLGKNAIKELALHLYKHPESAIKEYVTNGFDQQASKPKESIVKIRTHVGETDDIWIEDPGTGIEDYQKFILFLEGEKSVEGKVSSYETINPDIGGNKGLGKLGGLMLAGGEDDRQIIFLSHRPEIPGRYKKQCMKVTMTFDGFDPEYMDSTDPEALQEPGVRVIIKRARYDLLPDEAGLRKYESKMFAIRLSRGQKIIFNDKPVEKPEAFNSKEEELFTLKDGTTIYGNIKHCENPKAKNIWACIKNIYVEGWDFDNPAQGWFNDNLIIATSSRESIEKDARLAEINLNMQKYLDEHYPKPEGPKIGKMGKEKEKKALLIAGLQYREHMLSGQYDEKGIEGEITGGLGKKWNKKEGMQLLDEGGDPNGSPIIPIGEKRKPREPPIKHRGGTGSNPTAEEGGTRTVLQQEGQDKENKKGPIDPDIPSIIAQNPEKPMAWFNEDPLQFVWNTHWKETTRAHAAQGPDYLYLVAPVYAMALVNLDSDKELDKEEWQARYCKYIEFFIRKGGK